MIVLFKIYILVDFAGIQRPSSNSVRDTTELSLILLIVLFCLLLESRMRIKWQVVFNARSIADVVRSEDVIVFSFVHFQSYCLLNIYNSNNSEMRHYAISLKLLKIKSQWLNCQGMSNPFNELIAWQSIIWSRLNLVKDYRVSAFLLFVW